VLVLLAAMCAPRLAAANGERIHGLVLSVTPKRGEAVVRHDAFGGMPSMAMPFRVLPRERAAELLPGSEIDANVDTSTDPWTLRNVVTRMTDALTAPAPRRVVALQVGDTVPDTEFFDQSGHPFRFSMLRGQNVLLAFIFTRCRDPRMCPLISAHFNQLQHARANLHLVEVTLDPTYDRPPVLARYARTFGADPRRWTLAVGDAQATLDFAAQFGIAAFPDPNAVIIHTENTIEIGPDGVIRKMIPDAAWQPATILADIDNGNGWQPNPIARALGEFAGLLAIAAALSYLAFRIVRAIAVRRLES
jgi:protein SCO1/2